MPPDLRVYASAQELSLAAAELFVKSARIAIAERGKFVAAMSGGSTPRRTYELLSGYDFSSQVNWGAVHLFLGDERHVPLDDAQSNSRMVRETLLDALPAPKPKLHSVQTQLTPPRAAAAYEAEIRSVLGCEVRFDLIYLGLGSDGHTASLFPGTPVLGERDRLVADVYVGSLNSWRVTLTIPALNAARITVFLVSGDSKAKMLQNVLSGETFPASLVEPTDGEIIWLVDSKATASWHLADGFSPQ